MRLILSIFSFLQFIATANGGIAKEKITISPNAKTSQLEIKYQSKFKKKLSGKVVILNAAGNEVKNFTCDIINGSNTICMQNALNLAEGIFTVQLTVKNKTSSTKFVLFNRLDTNS